MSPCVQQPNLCVKVLGHPQPLFFKQSGGGVGMGVRSLPALICFCPCAPPATRSGHAGPGQTLPMPTREPGWRLGRRKPSWEAQRLPRGRVCLVGRGRVPQHSHRCLPQAAPSPIFRVPPGGGSCRPRDGQTQARDSTPQRGVFTSASRTRHPKDDQKGPGVGVSRWGLGAQEAGLRSVASTSFNILFRKLP